VAGIFSTDRRQQTNFSLVATWLRSKYGKMYAVFFYQALKPTAGNNF